MSDAEKKIVGRVRLREWASTDSAGKTETLDLREEEPLEIAFTMGEKGNPRSVLSDQQLGQSVGKKKNAKLFGRAFRGFYLALVELPPPDQEPDSVEYLRWVIDLPLGVARRQTICEAYPLGSQLVITGKTIGLMPGKPSHTRAGSEADEDLQGNLAQKFVAVFEDGRVHCAEYRSCFLGRTMVVRIHEQ